MIERKLDIAKRIIKENFCDADCGIFNCRNNAGDHMTNIYNDGELLIDVCYHWSYFEVFGLSDADFIELERFYDILRTKREQDEEDET